MRTQPDSIHAARARSPTLDRALEAPPSGPVAAENHRRTDDRRKPRVVKTFGGQPLIHQSLNRRLPGEFREVRLDASRLVSTLDLTLFRGQLAT